MPEQPPKKRRSNPTGIDSGFQSEIGNRKSELPFLNPEPGTLNPTYAELNCKTNFSFLRGASHPDELVEQAVAQGHAALAITDIDTLAGVVRFHAAAKPQQFKVLIGAELHPLDAPPICLYAMNRSGYGRLARIITQGRLRCRKGACEIHFDDIAEGAEGLIGMVVDDFRLPISDGRFERKHRCQSEILRYREVFGDRLYLGAALHGGPDDARDLAARAELSRRTRVPLVAHNDVHYHASERRFLQDVLTCIREKCTLDEAGTRLFANAERHLKAPQDMQRLFWHDPDAVARTLEVAGRCTFTLDELRYEYPQELCPPDQTPMQYLTELTWAGAREKLRTANCELRIVSGDTDSIRNSQSAIRNQEVPPKIRALIEHELKLIEELRYEAYFLTVWDLVRFARSRGILCQGRGSAANSAVCYCLGITSVDPERIDLLFERFVSRERNEPPDIDVDFEHERREEVFQYIYEKYGRERAGITAEVITYRPRSAVRDIGKALGLSLDRVDILAKRLDFWSTAALPAESLREAGLDPAERTAQMLIGLVSQIMGFPRHLSQHVGGFVMTRGPLCELVPIENGAMPGRTFIEWDKDDIDELGILKVDCLALGMMTAISKCLKLVNVEGGALTLDTIPPEDQAVYDMICAADTVGVFQIESRAQMSMLPRLRPRCFYDLVIEVAIVRPGPIQGGMVHPYLRRRNGEEAVAYPSPDIEAVLKKTLGVPLFQEQAMRLAVVAAGFTPGEADQLRRAMGAWRRSGVIEKFRIKLLTGMKANGLPEEFAQRCFEQISGFGEYGFPESHAASFALLVYVSAWLKHYYPAEFCAALLNSQPMGFYAPAQLVRDAIQHGVEVRRVDVNFSEYDCTLEKIANCELRIANCHTDDAQSSIRNSAVRLGLRQIKGISAAKVTPVVEARQAGGAFGSIEQVVRRSGVSRALLARLAAADAFRSLGLDRRAALWQVLSIEDAPLPLFADLERTEAPAPLPPQSLAEQVVHDYDTVGLSLTAHPMSLLREELKAVNVTPAAELRKLRPGMHVRVAGLVLVRQRPATAAGILFITLEDETSIANLIIRPQVYERHRIAARTAVALIADGRIERQGAVIHIQAAHLTDLSERWIRLRSAARDFH
ncbi:MAG TPA: error-prone DNA polymerase [Phycisphaerae bacterium]